VALTADRFLRVCSVGYTSLLL